MSMLFSQRIKEIRQEKMNQRNFAELFGVTQGALCRWALQENIPKLDILYQITKILNINAAYLLGLADLPAFYRQTPFCSAMTNANRNAVRCFVIQ